MNRRRSLGLAGICLATALLGLSGCGSPAPTSPAPVAAQRAFAPATTTRPPETWSTTTATPTTTATTAPLSVQAGAPPVARPAPVRTTVAKPAAVAAPAAKAPAVKAPVTKAAVAKAPVAAASGGGCDPNYSGCVPIDSDVDCAGGSGNGPSYVKGPVRVTGSDIYGLDADHDGLGCE